MCVNMLLKRLELQGYKTFAIKTEFLFDPGITAIVGPNGSGKSNVVDAVRWVLGEQSYRSLRAKRTEDMIFSGSAQRSRLGMAQAFLTFDNADGWLPIDYSEVTIGRRAYRSGENEYLLNGHSVRLKDINELLGSAGLSRRTYTVIGQGLIDAALSLRPEERRILFEEAAGITGYQAKRDNALVRLEATRQNIMRVNDIINEILPRLKRLERQAQQAHEYNQLCEELEGLLRIWHGYRWHQGQKNLALAKARLETQQEGLNLRKTELQNIEEQIDHIRARQSQRRQELSEWHNQSSVLHAQAEKVQRHLAVSQERHRLLKRQREEIVAEIKPLEIECSSQKGRIERTEAELIRLETLGAEQSNHLEEAQKRLEARQRQRRALLEELTTVRNQALALTTETANKGHHLAGLKRRRTEIETEREKRRPTIAHLENQLASLEDHLRQVEMEMDDLAVERKALAGQKEELQTAVEGRKERLAELEAHLGQAQRREEHWQARQEVLARMRQEMEGYRPGVRTILQAAGKDETGLTGIVGLVGNLVQAPARWEKAIEAALEGRLQDIVVQTRTQAEAALAFLREKKAGRVTFLPLETARPPESLAPPHAPDLIGLALDLVDFDPQLSPVFQLLLGRTLVVRDLTTARRLRSENHHFNVVTLDGQVLRAEGSISGGQASDESHKGVLTQEREWRELPARLAQTSERRRQIETHRQAEEREIQRLLAEINSLSERDRDLEAATRAKETERQTTDRERPRWQQALEEGIASLAQLAREMEALDGQESGLEKEIETLTAQEAALQERTTKLQTELEALIDDDLRREWGQWQTALAVTEQNQKNQKALLNSQRADVAHLEKRLATKRKRAEELERESDTLTTRIADLNSQAEELSARIQALTDLIEPVETELAALERAHAERQEEEARCRTRIRECETIYNQAALEMQRRQDELLNLRREIENDLGLVELEWEVIDGQPPLPLTPLVSALPSVEVLPDGLAEEIQRLRARQRRLGPINPNAPAEYAEALERHTFLTAQADDLQQAVHSLQTIIVELDQVMEKDFVQTFRAVAAEFRAYFTILFGGGAARLELTEPDRPLESGIDIVARLPGRRRQSLALLSGGEKTLTATALIFAILKVSPTPFCILDEVDAMLDEANIGRFREMLKELSAHTQFIVITHNRGTIESADTIYGISMGEDSASQAISLKLEDVAAINT